MVTKKVSNPFADAAELYLDAGWTSPIPLGHPGERAAKSPVPKHVTGRAARQPTERVISVWREQFAANNIGLHLPASAGIIGIDVDDYTKGAVVKIGGQTLTELEVELGPLPATFIATARGGPDGPGVSGIRFFRVPPELEFTTSFGDIDIIQAKHRYACVWPSVHPDTGKTYRWFSPAGERLRPGVVPLVDELPDLPKPWLAWLIAHASSSAGLSQGESLTDDDAREWLRAHRGEPCRAMRNVLNAELARFDSAASGSRYDTAVSAAMAVIRLGAEGHPGCSAAVRAVGDAYAAAVAGEHRDPSEWARLVVGAVSKVAESSVEVHGRRCPDRVTPTDPPKPPGGPGGAGGGSDYWPSPSQPWLVAERLLDELWAHPDGRTLVHWRGDHYEWTGTHFAMLDDNVLESRVWAILADAEWEGANGVVLGWNPTPTKINGVMHALRLNPQVLRPAGAPLAADDENYATISFANTLVRLHRATGRRKLVTHSPKFFLTSSLPFDYNEDAPEPTEWLKFLNSLEIEQDTIDLLQEFFGYVISGETKLNKFLYLYGATRSGKGTITRILKRLVGRENTASPTLDQFGQTFGLSSIVGKTLVAVNDARFNGRETRALVERFLTLTGDDDMQIDRKMRDPWEGKPTARVLVVSNDLPTLAGEQTTAFADRVAGPIHLPVSFLGREDTGLEKRLRGELAEILMWALDGYDRLCDQERFTVPSASVKLHNEIREILSPVLTFLRECCEVTGHDEDVVSKETMFDAYLRWSDRSNNRFRNNKMGFGRELLGVAGPGGATAHVIRSRQRRRRSDQQRYEVWAGVVLLDQEVRL